MHIHKSGDDKFSNPTNTAQWGKVSQLQSTIDVETVSFLNTFDSTSVLQSRIEALSIDFICAAIVTNLWNFTDQQIDWLWRAIAPRVSSASPPLHTWSNAELERMITNAQTELSQRHIPNISNH